MNRLVVNLLLVIGAAVVWSALGFYSGRIALNEGLGTEGPFYAAMVTAHDVGAGSVSNRIWPAFPLATAAAYAVTGNIVSSFALVDFVALLILLGAACLLLDALGAPLPVKVCTALTLSVLGIPTATAAYSPAQPYLLGAALMTLAVAACELGPWPLVLVTHAAATLASPAGIAAPLYGLARSWRLNRRSPMDLLAFAPALLVWLLIQVWARGGPAGLLDLLRFSRVHSDAVLWTEFSFMLFGAFFLLTTLGGLTILLWSHPRWINETMRARPELGALVVPVALFILTAGLEVPPMTALLIPFWLVVIAVWSHDRPSLFVPMVLAALATVVTQHPWNRITDVSYFVDWFPYSVYAARVHGLSPADVDIAAVWRPRVLLGAAAVAAFAVLWRTSGSWKRR